VLATRRQFAHMLGLLGSSGMLRAQSNFLLRMPFQADPDLAWISTSTVTYLTGVIFKSRNSWLVSPQGTSASYSALSFGRLPSHCSVQSGGRAPNATTELDKLKHFGEGLSLGHQRRKRWRTPTAQWRTRRTRLIRGVCRGAQDSRRQAVS